MGREIGAQNHKSQEPGARSQEPGARSQEPGARSQGASVTAPRALRGASSGTESLPSAAAPVGRTSAQRPGLRPRLTCPPDAAPATHPGLQTANLRRGGAGKTARTALACPTVLAGRAAAGLLLALAALLAPLPAAAQNIHSTTITVGGLNSKGYLAGNYGFITDATFSYDSVDYEIVGLFHNSAGNFNIRFNNTDISGLSAVYFYADGTAFPAASKSGDSNSGPSIKGWYWEGDLSWTVDETITVHIEQTARPATNAPATGAPTISGTAQVGRTLTASTTGIMDADGLTTVTWAYQWVRVDGTTETDIADATGATYTPVAEDVGKTLKVRASFTDDAGNPESLTSEATAAVAATVPGAPQNLRVEPGDEQVRFRWDLPSDTGGAPLTAFETRYKETAAPDEDFSAWLSGTPVTQVSRLFLNLTNGTTYTFEMRVGNRVGYGPAASIEGTPVFSETAIVPSAPQKPEGYFPRYFRT